MGMEELWTTLWWMQTLFAPKVSGVDRVRPVEIRGKTFAKKDARHMAFGPWAPVFADGRLWSAAIEYRTPKEGR